MASRDQPPSDLIDVAMMRHAAFVGSVGLLCEGLQGSKGATTCIDTLLVEATRARHSLSSLRGLCPNSITDSPPSASSVVLDAVTKGAGSLLDALRTRLMRQLATAGSADATGDSGVLFCGRLSSEPALSCSGGRSLTTQKRGRDEECEEILGASENENGGTICSSPADTLRLPASRCVPQPVPSIPVVAPENPAVSDLVASCLQLPGRLSVGWGDIVGAEDAVSSLRQALLLPKRLPHLFAAGNPFRQPPKCILLYGPPGTGKTMLAVAAARESKSLLLSVSASDLLSKWVGGSERHIRELFDHNALHSHHLHASGAEGGGDSVAPFVIIFLDEIDALCGARGASGESEAARRVKTEFLVRMQSLDPSRAMVIAATNMPWDLDPAFRRRFQRFVHVRHPSHRDRELILERAFATLHADEVDIGSFGGGPSPMPFCSSGVPKWSNVVRRLASLLDGYSSAEVSTIIQAAFTAPLRRLESARLFRRISPLDATGALSCSHCLAASRGGILADFCRAHSWHVHVAEKGLEGGAEPPSFSLATIRHEPDAHTDAAFSFASPMHCTLSPRSSLADADESSAFSLAGPSQFVSLAPTQPARLLRGAAKSTVPRGRIATPALLRKGTTKVVTPARGQMRSFPSADTPSCHDVPSSHAAEGQTSPFHFCNISGASNTGPLGSPCLQMGAAHFEAGGSLGESPAQLLTKAAPSPPIFFTGSYDELPTQLEPANRDTATPHEDPPIPLFVSLPPLCFDDFASAIAGCPRATSASALERYASWESTGI